MSHLMAEFRCWISSLSLWTSSCSCALSCCILLMYSDVFCSVVALLICASTWRDYDPIKHIVIIDIFLLVLRLQIRFSGWALQIRCHSLMLFSSAFNTFICNAAARLLSVPLCSAGSWGLSRGYVKCQIPVWCWNVSFALQRCELSSWSLFAADSMDTQIKFQTHVPIILQHMHYYIVKWTVRTPHWVSSS